MDLFGGRKRLLADPHKLGRWGQRQAERFLRKNGWRTVARNFAFGGGEIDLIAADRNGMVAFVEVKTRRSEDYAPAVSAVTFAKQQKLIRTAKCFLRQYDLSESPLRFDVITVILPPCGPVEIRHYPGAFRPCSR
ncbi:MAG: YraN family protein [Anaerohalosphaeraceae bacterium]